jgi:hypothetical protein
MQRSRMRATIIDPCALASKFPSSRSRKPCRCDVVAPRGWAQSRRKNSRAVACLAARKVCDARSRTHSCAIISRRSQEDGACGYLSQKLDRPLPTKDGGTLRTIGEACDYMTSMGKKRELQVRLE